MARIVTVYSSQRRRFSLEDMSYIRWLKISDALGRLGHQVDIATNESWLLKYKPHRMGRNLRRIHLSKVRWGDYDAVKTLFHNGFRTLAAYGGSTHPFIISKLGSVVGPKDMDGIYFYGENREVLYSVQERISQSSRYVTVLSEPAKRLWEDCYGLKDNILLVPGAADRDIPVPGEDPYPDDGRVRCLFAGNIYDRTSQPEANAALVGKLNLLGKLLSERGARLYMMGPGDTTRLDKKNVTYLGVIPYGKSWDYLHFADAGVVVSAGGFMHNNESTKIYHYLRAGLPVVSESGFPNDNVVLESKLGFVVENGNIPLIADKVVEAAGGGFSRDFAVNYILENHTWDKRAEVYDSILGVF
jgi:hypothetical protein